MGFPFPEFLARGLLRCISVYSSSSASTNLSTFSPLFPTLFGNLQLGQVGWPRCDCPCADWGKTGPQIVLPWCNIDVRILQKYGIFVKEDFNPSILCSILFIQECFPSRGLTSLKGFYFFGISLIFQETVLVILLLGYLSYFILESTF